MNKITKLNHQPPRDPTHPFGFTTPPTFEDMQAHIAEMNNENWKMISHMRTSENDLIFFWEKDVMLAEVANA